MHPDDMAALEAALAASDLDRVVALGWVVYHAKLSSYARERGVHADDVDDVLQHVFMRVFDGQIPSDGEGFRRWLFTVTRYQGRTWAARRSRQELRTVDVWGGSIEQAKSRIDAEDHAEIRMVLDIVSALDAVDRSVFVAAFVYELTHRETVEYVYQKTGRVLSVDAVRWRRVRIRNRVRKMLLEGSP